MFGGNSNWRGPMWFPLNYLVVSALERYAPVLRRRAARSSTRPAAAPADRSTRSPTTSASGSISLFLVGADGRRPCFGWSNASSTTRRWKDNIVFNEYFHGDNGAGLGATHQTGWTGLVADLIRGRPGDGVYASCQIGQVLAACRRDHPTRRGKGLTCTFQTTSFTR